MVEGRRNRDRENWILLLRQYPQRDTDLRGGESDSRGLPHDPDHVIHDLVDPLRPYVRGVDLPCGFVQDRVPCLDDLRRRCSLLPAEAQQPPGRGPRRAPHTTPAAEETRRDCTIGGGGGEKGFRFPSGACVAVPLGEADSGEGLPAATCAEEKGMDDRSREREHSSREVDGGLHDGARRCCCGCPDAGSAHPGWQC